MYISQRLCFLNHWIILTSCDSYKALLFPARIESLWLTWGLTCVQQGCHSTLKDASSSFCLVLHYLFNSQHLSLPINPFPSGFASVVRHPRSLYRCMSIAAHISWDWGGMCPSRLTETRYTVCEHVWLYLWVEQITESYCTLKCPLRGASLQLKV